MKKLLLALVMLCLLVAAGCGGGGDNSPSVFTKEIASDETVDADIVVDRAGNATVTQVSADNVPSVFAGIDPSNGDEYRAFLDFPLDIPLDAVIHSATVSIFIDTIQPVNGIVPIRLELVSFPPPVIASDFDRNALPPLAFALINNPPVDARDVGHDVVVDVTDLVALAQQRRQHNPQLQNFQLRVMEDLGQVPPGLIEIDQTTKAPPLLKVTYHRE